MRAEDGPDWLVSDKGALGAWTLGRPIHLAWPKTGWGTPFSGFRFAVPEMMGFQGTAIYLDADMLVLGDLAELLTYKRPTGYTCCHVVRTDVSVIDCGWFKGKPWWPSVAQMRTSGWCVPQYLGLLHGHNGVSAAVPWEWNDCEGGIFERDPKRVRLIHYTGVPDQPYRPYPEVEYPKAFPFSRHAMIGHLWWETYREALAAEFGAAQAAEMVERRIRQ